MTVDIILSVYKPKPWVFDTLASILSQTFRNWRTLIIDDATPLPDETINRIFEFATSNPKMSYVRLSSNRRVAGARMEAVQQTQGDIICFIDQDDIWEPEKIQKQIEFYEKNSSVAVTHTDICKIDSYGNVIERDDLSENRIRAEIDWQNLTTAELSRILFRRNSIRIVSASIKRDAFLDVGGIDASLFGGEDWEFWVRLSAQHKVGHIPEQLVRRRIHHNNVSDVFSIPRMEGKFKALKKMEMQYPYLKDLIPKKEMHLYFEGLKHACRKKRIKDVIKYFVPVMYKYPLELLSKL